MPPEPLPWDRKDFFKERKHERSESLGSVARWRDSSHHGSREFSRWGSADFRRPPGHGKQGGWHLFPEESGHGYALSRSSDKMPEEENCRPSASRGDGKYGRNSRENRGSFSQRDWRGHSWETTNGSLNLSRRPPDVTNDQRSADDMLTYPSHPHSDFVNTWDQHHLKDQHDKMVGVNGLSTGQRCDRENSLGSIAWKPLKWTRSGSLSSRGSGFSHTSSSRSIGGADSNEEKSELQPKSATPIESHSGDGATCVTSSAPSEETMSRKKPRLNWGEGLAKYEKKKVEEPDVSASKDGPVLSTSNMEPCHFLGSNLPDKSPKVTGFSDCASPATPSSVACSSSPGAADDKLYGKAANVDNDVSTLSGSLDPGTPHNHLRALSFNLEKLDIDSLSSLGSSLIELLQSDDPSSADPSTANSAAMSKLLIWKADLSKVLEVTEAEIDSLESKMKVMKSESGNNGPCPAALGSFLVGNNTISCEEHVGGSDKVSRPEPLQICTEGPDAGMSPSTNIHENGKEEDIDSPGTATSKFVEPQPLINAVSSCDMRRNEDCFVDLDAIQSASTRCLVPCSTSEQASVSACGGRATMVVDDGMDGSPGSSVCSRTYGVLYNTISSSNKEMANSSSEQVVKSVPKDCCKASNSDLCAANDVFIKEKFAGRMRFARFKEQAIALKFKALHHRWKEDMRLLSVRKCRPKSHKKIEVGIRTTIGGYQKNRSSVRSRISYPGNNSSLVTTPEVINFASKLLSDPQVKVHRSTLKMPALILNDKEKKISRFPSSNRLIKDPIAYEKARAMNNLWTSEEKDIFMDKFAAFGKDFRKIASFLDHKTTADCVEFYYKNHKSDCFEKIKQDSRKIGKSFLTNTDLVASGKKWNREINAASLEILSAASAMAGHADSINGNKKIRSGSFLLGSFGNMKTSKGGDSIPERSNSFDALGDEREAVAADVLAGICGSLSSEAVSSCITSSVDPVEGSKDGKCLKVNITGKQLLIADVAHNVDDDTCSDESCEEMDPADWTDEEKSSFLQAVSSFGKDFAKISRYVGSRSQDQCRVFFSKARKCLGLDFVRPKSVNTGYPVNDNVNGGGSDTDDACVVETGSAIGTDRSGTKTDEDQPLSAINTYSDEFNPDEARNLSTDLNKTNVGPESDTQDAEDVDNMVSDACEMKGKSKLGSSGGGDVLYSSDKSGTASGQTAISMSASIDVGKDEAYKLASAVTELVPCQSNSVVDVSSGDLVKELEGQKQSRPQFLDDRDTKHAGVSDVVAELKSSVQDSSTVVNASLSSGGNSCTGLNLEADNQCQESVGGPCISSLMLENSQSTANLLLQDTLHGQKTAGRDQLPTTCDFQGRSDMHCHNSTSNDGQQIHIPRHLMDRAEATTILQGFPLPIKKEVNGDMSCSSSGTELPLLSQKIEHASDHYKTHLQHSVDSEVASRNGDVKLFGKILTNTSSTQKSNLSSKGREENGTRHLKFSSKSSSLNFSGHQNADGNSTILKFDRNDYNIGLENVPMRSYGYWDGNKIQTGIPSLPDSTILLAKYPAAFSNYPTSSAKLEQQSMQAFTNKSNEQHLNGASFASREINSSNGVIDYQMFRSRDVPKVQPFMVDMKHRQDVFSEVQRRNGFEAISNLQQQGRGMVGLNGVGRPGILVGGSHSGVSDLVAAIKMHYSNSEQYGSQNGSIMREDESWGGKKGDLSR
ncbi:Nuclear receptor corepressor 1 [Senna tora]|uniref:Nuclear receptor corepressor 1 n=1 Tax=Senna tora TaxID=362788 RepID=A0A834TFC8_9FABA|nr:Nuclear receptor corepressor 1 [Senna tora]